MRRASCPVWRVPALRPGRAAPCPSRQCGKPSVVCVARLRSRARPPQGGWYSSTQPDATLPRPTRPRSWCNRQGQALAVLNHHEAGVGHVHADLDHGGGDQQWPGRLPLRRVHDLPLVARLHAPMHEADAQIGRAAHSRHGQLRRLRLQLLGLRMRVQTHRPWRPSAAAAAIRPITLLWRALRSPRWLIPAQPRRQFVDHRHVEVGVGGHGRVRESAAEHELMRYRRLG